MCIAHLCLAVFQLIPDAFFRCPLPFLFVSVFSCRTLAIIRQQQQQNITRNSTMWRRQTVEKRITILLIVCCRLCTFATLLNVQILVVKYFVCNSLFMAITVVRITQVWNGYQSEDIQKSLQVSVTDRKDVDDNEVTWWRMYMSMLYMTDVSNMLFVLHSATNWILFYNWGFKLRTRTCK